MLKECILAQGNLLHLGCWNCLEKLAEMFLNTFHRKICSINDAVKNRKVEISSKNITAVV